MGKTYTDFSQLSKGMFKKSDPMVEIKPIPKKSAGGDDALAYFGLNAPEAPTHAPCGGADATDASRHSKRTWRLYALNLRPWARPRRRRMRLSSPTTIPAAILRRARPICSLLRLCNLLRAKEFEANGLKAMDALHVACAEAAKCDWFFTTDRGVLKKARDLTSMRVANPVEFFGGD